jgi:hypothetical protein
MVNQLEQKGLIRTATPSPEREADEEEPFVLGRPSKQDN